MSKSISYVGVDVGKTELWAAMDGCRPRMFANTPAGIRSLQRWCRQRTPEGTLHVCMEATGVYSPVVATRLLNSGDPDLLTSIVNPSQIHAFAKAQLRRAKTDAVDARVILAFAQSQRLRPWTPESPALQQLYELVRQADTVQEALQAWTNRAGTHADGRVQSRVVRRTDRTICNTLQRELDRLHAAIDALCHSDSDLRRQCELLRSIPGIGERTAPRLLAYGRSAWMTFSEKELTAYAGLAPRHRQSGTSVRKKSHFDKQGNAGLRRALFFATLNGVRYNAPLIARRKRLLDKGKPKMLAIGACMRHLLLIARAVLREQRPFDPNYATSNP